MTPSIDCDRAGAVPNEHPSPTQVNTSKYG